LGHCKGEYSANDRFIEYAFEIGRRKRGLCDPRRNVRDDEGDGKGMVLKRLSCEDFKPSGSVGSVHWFFLWGKKEEEQLKRLSNWQWGRGYLNAQKTKKLESPQKTGELEIWVALEDNSSP